MNLNELTSEEKALLRPLLHKVLAMLDSKSSTSCATCGHLDGDSFCAFYNEKIPADWFDSGCEQHEYFDDIPF
jgi:hypothetical protein